MKKDFSIRYEVEVMLENIGVKMTDSQIDDIIESIELNDTFLGVIGLFVAKGIEEIAQRDNVNYDDNKIEHQFNVNRNSIDYSEL